jgi:hypothetical protein
LIDFKKKPYELPLLMKMKIQLSFSGPIPRIPFYYLILFKIPKPELLVPKTELSEQWVQAAWLYVKTVAK